MKLTCVFALLTLSVVIKGNLLVALTRPAILSIGTIYAAFNQNILDVKPIEWKNIVPFSIFDGDTSKRLPRKSDKELLETFEK